jgi:hypothetical protein
MKVLVDMNLSPRWVDAFTDAGIEAAHWSSLGARTAADFALASLKLSIRANPSPHPHFE